LGADIRNFAQHLCVTGWVRPRQDGDSTGDHEPITPSVPVGQLPGRGYTNNYEQEIVRGPRPGKGAGKGKDVGKDLFPEGVSDRMRLYQLIVRYFLATVSPDFVMEAREVTFSLDSVDVEVPFAGTFRAQHRSLVDRAWVEILPIEQALALETNSSPELITALRPEDRLSVLSVKVVPQPRRAPRKLTISRLVHEMEVQGIGTDASIPAHIDNLLTRGYLKLIPVMVDSGLPIDDAAWAWHMV